MIVLDYKQASFIELHLRHDRVHVCMHDYFATLNKWWFSTAHASVSPCCDCDVYVLLEGDERDVVAVEEADDAARELAVLRKLLCDVLQWLVRQLSDLQERTQQNTIGVHNVLLLATLQVTRT